MDLKNLPQASKLLNLKNEIKDLHRQLNEPKNKLAVVNTEYDGPGISYTTLSTEMKIKIKELLYILDQNIDNELQTL
jgi:hypothetical protein